MEIAIGCFVFAYRTFGERASYLRFRRAALYNCIVPEEFPAPAPYPNNYKTLTAGFVER